MKNLLLFVVCIFLYFSSFCQEGTIVGNQMVHKFIVNTWGGYKWGLLYLPSDFYSNPTRKYHVISFHHGVGETGSGGTNLSVLLRHGSPYLIANGNTMTFNSVNTGREYKFIHIALQDPGWSPVFSEVYYALKNDPIIKDRIDWNGIFVTGISAGGQTTINSILTTQEISNFVTAIVPMSSASDINWSNMNFVRQSQTKVKMWAFHGLQDQVCNYITTQRMTDSMNNIRASAKWTKAPANHSNWNDYYKLSYREIFNGIAMNIFEWMISNLKSEQVLLLNETIIPPYIVNSNFYYDNNFISIKVTMVTKYRFYDIIGHKLLDGYLKQGINKIDISNYPSGIYILKIENKNTIKIIKQL